MVVTDVGPGEEPTGEEPVSETTGDLGATSIGPLEVASDPTELPAPIPGLSALTERLKRMQAARQAHAERVRKEPPPPPIPDPGERPG